jgi:hypothetical protein
MENKDISQIALERIKESGIKPISKNIFNLKRVTFWVFVGLSVTIGAMSFSVVLSILFNNDWDLYNRFGFNFIFRTLPYFWFVCLAIFTILGDFYYRKTSIGYRNSTIVIIGIYITLTVISGSILHFIGVGETIEESLSKNISIYRGVMFDKNNFWNNPEEGLISGKIINIEGNTIKLVDFGNNIWVVGFENANVGKRVQIKEGETIKIIGDTCNDYCFDAEQIRPWMNKRQRGQ